MIGPTVYEQPIPPTVAAVSDEIRKAAEQTKTPFLNALNPPWLTPDRCSPTVAAPMTTGSR